MTGYPELDELTPMLTALRTRTDYRSDAWHEAANEIGAAFDTIAAKRDELAAWLAEAKQWIEANQKHPAHAERLRVYVMANQKHKSYQAALERAADVLEGITAIPDEEPEAVTQLPMDERTKPRTTLTDRVRQRRTSAA